MNVRSGPIAGLLVVGLMYGCSDGTGPSRVAAVLTVQSFSVIEYQYAGSSQYYYAPQLVLADSGQVSAAVVKVLFTIPGLESVPPYCPVGIRVPAGQSTVMLGDGYWDYGDAYWKTGSRAAPGQATVAVLFHGGPHGPRGIDTLYASGPISPGIPLSTEMAGSPLGYASDCSQAKAVAPNSNAEVAH